jgi:hypothetical protein
VFDKIPQPKKFFKDTQNRDDPGIMAWDHYIHENSPDQEENAKTPWKYSSCKLQDNTSSSSSSQGFCSNPHEVRPPSPQDLRPSSLLQKKLK